MDQTALEEATAAVTAAQTALDNAPTVLSDAQQAEFAATVARDNALSGDSDLDPMQHKLH